MTTPLAASFGIASLEPEDGDIFDTLLRADRALYRAKDAGRNRVAADRPWTAEPDEA